MFSRVMNKSIKHACRSRLQVLLQDEETSLVTWHERHKKLINATRQKSVERNYHKRINALKVVIWMLSDYGQRDPDLPTLITKKPKELKIKEPKQKLLPPNKVEENAMPTISQEDLAMLLNLAKVLSPKK